MDLLKHLKTQADAIAEAIENIEGGYPLLYALEEAGQRHPGSEATITAIINEYIEEGRTI